MKKLATTLLTLVLLLSACGASGDIEAHNAWARPATKGENTAVYLTLHNHSSQADELIGASSPAAEAVELHETIMEDNVMKMSPVASVPLAANEEVTFEPGSLHIMLIGVKEDLKPGGHIGVILHFKNHEDITLEVPVGEAMPAENHMHGDSSTHTP